MHFSSPRYVQHAALALLKLIILTIFGEKYKLWSSLLCNFPYLVKCTSWGKNGELFNTLCILKTNDTHKLLKGNQIKCNKTELTLAKLSHLFVLNRYDFQFKNVNITFKHCFLSVPSSDADHIYLFIFAFCRSMKAKLIYISDVDVTTVAVYHSIQF